VSLTLNFFRSACVGRSRVIFVISVRIGGAVRYGHGQTYGLDFERTTAVECTKTAVACPASYGSTGWPILALESGRRVCIICRAKIGEARHDAMQPAGSWDARRSMRSPRSRAAEAERRLFTLAPRPQPLGIRPHPGALRLTPALSTSGEGAEERERRRGRNGGMRNARADRLRFAQNSAIF
jgi:hypothetical protein